MGPWNGWHMGYWGWGGMIVMGILMLLFWAGVIALVFFAIRWLVQSGAAPRREDLPGGRVGTPLEILKERYARGEITREQYLDIKRDLEI